MAEALHDMRIGFLVANEGVEQVELTEPWRAVEEAGGTPMLIAPEPGTVRAMNHLDWADTFEVDRTTDSVRADKLGDFDAFCTTLVGAFVDARDRSAAA